MNVLGGRPATPQLPNAGRSAPQRGRTGKRPPRILAWLPATLLVAAGCTVSPPAVTPADLPSAREALLLLEQLPPHSADYYQSAYAYDRDYFGAEWYDTDANGRGTRDDVLAAQLSDVTYTPAGDVATGWFIDPYTGDRVDYVRAREETNPVVVDHVVSLWEAWATGAWAWTPDERLAFANDPINLVATTYNINELKGPQNAARWHPATHLEECVFAIRVVATKSKYGLEIHESDRDYLRDVLYDC